MDGGTDRREYANKFVHFDRKKLFCSDILRQIPPTFSILMAVGPLELSLVRIRGVYICLKRSVVSTNSKVMKITDIIIKYNY